MWADVEGDEPTAADDQAVLLWSWCSASVCGPEGGARIGCGRRGRPRSALIALDRCRIPDPGPTTCLCDVAQCPAYVKSSFGRLSWLIQFMVTVMKKSGWSLDRLSVAEYILWLLRLASRAHLVSSVSSQLQGNIK